MQRDNAIWRTKVPVAHPPLGRQMFRYVFPRDNTRNHLSTNLPLNSFKYNQEPPDKTPRKSKENVVVAESNGVLGKQPGQQGDGEGDGVPCADCAEEKPPQVRNLQIDISLIWHSFNPNTFRVAYIL